LIKTKRINTKWREERYECKGVRGKRVINGERASAGSNAG